MADFIGLLMNSEAQKKIKVIDIEAELTGLQESQKRKGQVRANLFNLIVYAQESQRSQCLHELVQSIIEKFPCRIIFIEGSQAQDDQLTVSVTSEFAHSGDQVIACDQILIKASGNMLRRVPFLIMPHFISDLPIYLLWGQNPTRDQLIFPSLQSMATRLIFDATYSHGLQQFSSNILSLIDHNPIDLMDLHWAQISCWRDLVANIFDNPLAISQLEKSNHINLQYLQKVDSEELYPRDDIQAIYFIGWLIAQMQWKFHSKATLPDHSRQLICTTSNGKVVINISPQKPNNVLLEKMKENKIHPGAILNIEIETTDKKLTQIARQPESYKAIVYTSSLETCELPYTVPLPSLRKGSSFMKELFYYCTSCHYHNMLKAIAHFD